MKKNPILGFGWQTGPDEAALYTDVESLRAFAQELLKAADRLEEEGEVQVEKRVIHPLSEFGLDWVVLVRDEKELVSRIQEHQ